MIGELEAGLTIWYGIAAKWRNSAFMQLQLIGGILIDRGMDSAEKFIKSSELISTYKIKSYEIRVLILDPFHSHGLWSGVNPFKIDKS